MIREALQKDITIMQKSSPVDLVTETDQKVEQLIISSLKEKYPTHRCAAVMENLRCMSLFFTPSKEHRTEDIRGMERWIILQAKFILENLHRGCRKKCEVEIIHLDGEITFFAQ